MTNTYPTITKEQLEDWDWDENHMISIFIPREHLMTWIDSVPSAEDIDDDFDFEFTKFDDETFRVSDFCPTFWTECSAEDFEQAVLDKYHLKKEWIEYISVDG